MPRAQGVERKRRKSTRQRVFCPEHPGGGHRCQACTDAGLTAAFIDKRDQGVKLFRKGKHSSYKPPKKSLDVAKLESDFMSMDINGDGQISKSELKVMLMNQGEDSATATRYVADYFRLNDTDDSGTITFDEFVKEYVRMQKFKAVRGMQAKFQEIDKDGDGSISRTEFLHALTLTLGKRRAEEEIDVCFNEIDADGSGEISMEELALWYVTKAEQLHEQRVKRKTLLREARENKRADSVASRRKVTLAPPHQIKILFTQKGRETFHFHDLRDGDLLDYRLKKGLNFNVQQNASLSIVGLQRIRNDGKWGADPSDVVAFYKGKIKTSGLTARATYEVMVKDVAQSRLDALTPEERSGLRDMFDAMDSNHSGTIDVSEIEEILAHKSESAKSQIYRTMVGAERKQALQELKKTDHILKRILTGSDTNNDGEIDFDEFLLAHARALSKSNRIAAAWRSEYLHAGRFKQARMEMANADLKDQEVKNRSMINFENTSEHVVTQAGDFYNVKARELDEEFLQFEFNRADVNRDGLISREELQSLLTYQGVEDDVAVEMVQDFWRWTDTDGDGQVNFAEFKEKYLPQHLPKFKHKLKKRGNNHNKNPGGAGQNRIETTAHVVNRAGNTYVNRNGRRNGR